MGENIDEICFLRICEKSEYGHQKTSIWSKHMQKLDFKRNYFQRRAATRFGQNQGKIEIN